MTADQHSTISLVARNTAGKFLRSSPWLQREEIEQEVWVVCLASLRTYDPAVGDLASYLYRVALRAAKHLVWRMSVAANVPRCSATSEKVSAARATTDSEERLLGVAAEQDDAAAALEQAEAQARLAQVLAEYLAEGREGEITRAVLAGEMSNLEGAEALGIKPNALYQRTFQLRRRLAADARLQEVR